MKPKPTFKPCSGAFASLFVSFFVLLAMSSVSVQGQWVAKSRPFKAHQSPSDFPAGYSIDPSTNNTESTTALWTFDFSSTTGMTVQNDANGGARWKIVSALEPNLTNFGSTLNSVSGAPFALINSDSFNNDTQDDYLTLRVGTSLVGQYGIQLSFRHFFRRFAEDHIVEVSNDSSTWVQVYNSNGLIPTNTTINNPTLARFNISSVAGNQDSVWIRFHYVGAWEWFWALDDIEISTLPPNDLVLEDYDISPKLGLCYNAQMALPHLQDSLIFSAAVLNFGQNSQPNSRLNAKVFQNASPLYNTTTPGLPLSSNSRDTLETSPFFALSGRSTGTYTLRMEVLSDSVDGSPANNVDTTMLVITNNLISPYYPATTVPGAIGTSSFTGETDGVVVTSLFNLTSTDTVTDIRVYLRSTTVAGGMIAVSVRDTDGLASTPAIEFPIIVESDLTTVTAADVSRGYKDIPIPTIIAGSPQDRVLPAGPYYAAAQLFSNTGANHIRVADDLSNEAFMPTYASLVYLPVDGAWYSNGTAVGLAARFGDPTSTSLEDLQVTAPSAYPNPFNDLVTWDLDRQNPGTLQARCYDLQGRLVAEGPALYTQGGSSSYRFDLSNLPDAMYRVELWSENQRLGAQLMLKK